MTSNRFVYFILGAFIASAALLLALQYNSRQGIRRLVEGNERLALELRAGNTLRQAERDILSSESRVRASVATRDTGYLVGINELVAEAEYNIDTLRRTFDDDSIRYYLGRLAALGNRKGGLADELLAEYRSTGQFPANILTTSPLAIRDSNQVDLMTRNIYRRRQSSLVALQQSIMEDGRQVQRLELLLVVVGVISGAVFFWFIINRIRHQNKVIRQLDATEKIKENFLANMSHEIRTPLNAILGFTSIMKVRNKDTSLKEFIDSIDQAGENLLGIVNDILDISKIEAGMIRIETAPFSLRHLLNSVQVMFGNRIREKGLDLQIAVDDTLPDHFEGDSMRLTQILVNLIGNAIKFTDTGHIRVQVAGAYAEGQYALEFAVSDTGIGIDKKNLARIFDRFQQAENSTARRYGGTGLGLSIVRDLVHLQHGTIRAESDPGKGTTFFFTIPYEQREAPPAEIAKEEAFTPGSHYGRLLVVEDNSMNQNLVRHLLSGWGIAFDMAGSGAEAIRALETNTYDLVLMDIQMPEMDGYAATRHIRHQLKMGLPVIAMTAHAMAGEREKCLAAGMNEYLSKPLREKDLYDMITRFLPGFRYIDLRYMRDISRGDREYETLVSEQYITQTPGDLSTLATARNNGDTDLLRRTAHHMKNNVAVMGLLPRLETHLDALEYQDLTPSAITTHIETIRTICMGAMEEARRLIPPTDR